jgi:hypothetical protein
VIFRGLAEIASDIELVSGSWSAVVSDLDHLDEIRNELRDEIEFALESSDSTVTVLDASEGIDAIVRHLMERSPKDVVLVFNNEALDVAARQRLDSARTSLEGGPRVVFVMSEPALTALARDAPHLWSWVGPRVFSVDPASGRLDVQARLASLREGTGLTDDEIVRRAQAGELPADPVYAEWLLLLDRGDLLGS